MKTSQRPGTSRAGARVTAMSGNEERNLTVRWLWKWIARERKKRGISRSEFARRLGIRRETLYRIEEVRSGGSEASTLIDALELLGALGAIAEIDGMDWHGTALSLSKHETKKYDAIARDSNLTRAQVIRQLAAEGLLARGRPRRGGAENVASMEVDFWLSPKGDSIELRSVSEGERLVMTVDRKQPDLFGKLEAMLRRSGAPAPAMEGDGDS